MRNWLYLGVCLGLTLPWIIFRLLGIHLSAPLIAISSGICIIGAAFILSWACEAAQKDISQTLAIAFLALIAVLPEYAVDIYFAWMAGKNPVYTSYATANMTGANRLLIGFGWTLVAFLFYFKYKKKGIELEEFHSVEIFFLLLATIYSFIIPIKGNLSIIDAVVLISIFVLYIICASREGIIEPELIGPAENIANLSAVGRRSLVIFLFLFAGAAILMAAEPFAESLIKVGKSFGIEEFILVQWVAPLASESPEIIVASLFVLKNEPGQSLGALVSSKINQWTLLIGMLPVVFVVSGLKLTTMHLDARQTEEILLTSAQSLFAIVILANLTLSLKESLFLFILFFTQLLFPNPTIRYTYSAIYFILSLFILLRKGQLQLRSIIKMGIKTVGSR